MIKINKVSIAGFMLAISCLTWSCHRYAEFTQESSSVRTAASGIAANSIAANAITNRIALIEYRYPDSVTCKLAAANYYLGLGNSGTPTRLLNSPLTYSFRKPSSGLIAAKEVRFTVIGSAFQEIDYCEVKKKAFLPTDITNEKELKDVIKELENDGAVATEPIKSDNESVNGKNHGVWCLV
ncbi:hypothetical protein [Hymenobacter sp. UYCo722]|uniref:hypothetical protein n=1 Tax=Hymenobacter sp. UYCo722 TaxID=3156335 RepID=UPI00339B9674